MIESALAGQLAGWVLRHGGDEVVAEWTRRLVTERAQGHSCIDLSAHAGGDLPGLAESRTRLVSSALVGDGSDVTPLVLKGDLLALYRDHVSERRLARDFGRRAEGLVQVEVTEELRQRFETLYPDATATGAALAALTALLSRLTIVTGGPGTGKTTAVVRMLALLLATDPDLEIVLAAPTGKAAARLQESVHGQLPGLPLPEATRRRLELAVRTIHKTLGVRPGAPHPRHGPERPLAADVVVIDEASMVDLQLMDLLVAAVRPDARLVLVGDRDQLASVEAGAVLADLVSARGGTDDGRSPGFAAAARGFGVDVEAKDASRPLADALVELRVNHRFDTRPGIATVAEALRAGDADAVVSVLTDAAAEDARLMPLSPANLTEVLDPVLGDLPSPEETDAALWLDLLEHRFRLLGATHAGRAGVAALNELVQSRLRVKGWSTDETWYAGRPVLIERNHHGLELSNGDLGVCLPDPGDASRRVFYVRGGSGIRQLAVEQLPAHRTAWAMTLHKSQGSEFDHVLITLPPGGHPLLSRELLYTGVTRARERVTVFADEATIREAIRAVQQRRTGLTEALRGA